MHARERDADGRCRREDGARSERAEGSDAGREGARADEGSDDAEGEERQNDGPVGVEEDAVGSVGDTLRPRRDGERHRQHAPGADKDPCPRSADEPRHGGTREGYDHAVSAGGGEGAGRAAAAARVRSKATWYVAAAIPAVAARASSSEGGSKRITVTSTPDSTMARAAALASSPESRPRARTEPSLRATASTAVSRARAAASAAGSLVKKANARPRRRERRKRFEGRRLSDDSARSKERVVVADFPGVAHRGRRDEHGRSAGRRRRRGEAGHEPSARASAQRLGNARRGARVERHERLLDEERDRAGGDRLRERHRASLARRERSHGAAGEGIDSEDGEALGRGAHRFAADRCGEFEDLARTKAIRERDFERNIGDPTADERVDRVAIESADAAGARSRRAAEEREDAGPAVGRGADERVHSGAPRERHARQRRPRDSRAHARRA